MRQTAESLRLKQKARILLAKYARTIPTNNKGDYRLDQIDGYLDNFRLAMRKRDLKWLRQKRGFRNRPVDVLTFAEHDDFLGQDAWESSKETLWKIFHEDPEPSEVVLTGSPGTGKSFVGFIAIGYIRYLLNCLHNPQLEFGLSPNSSIFLVFQSLKESTANDSLFEPLKLAIDDSPYFAQCCPRRSDKQKVNTQLIFHDNVRVLSFTGALTAAIGKNLFAIVITEANFMRRIKGSVHLQDSDKDTLDEAREMYSTARNRMKDRFALEDGTFPGKIVVDSARNYVGDFSDQMIERTKRDPKHQETNDGETFIISGNNTLIISRTLWSAKRHKYLASEARFLVELATDTRPARIIAKLEDAEDPENVISVPERHRQEFEDDIESALKDLAGVPSTKTGRFIPFPEKISAAQQRWRDKYGEKAKGLFLVDNLSLLDFFGNGVDWDRLINQKFLDILTVEGEFNWAVHVDTSLSGDATGVAVGRVIDLIELAKAGYWHAKEGRERTAENIRAAIYQIDGILRIFAKPGEQIDVNLVRDLALELNDRLPGGVKYGSADWMESAAMLQAWLAAKINAGYVSVDGRGGKPPTDFFELKHATREDRLIVVPHEWGDREWRRLVRTIQGGRVKVDHPPNESKDCIDGVTGVVGVLMRCEGRKERIQQKEGEGEELEEQRQEEVSQARVKHKLRTYRTRRGFGGLRRFG